MTILYFLAIKTYVVIVLFFSVFNKKASMMIKGRKGWKKKLAERVTPKKKYVWVHCASLGEFEQARPLIERIKKDMPDNKILLTFFSPSGYEIRKNYQYADIVSYLPFDSPRNAKNFVSIINPKYAIFIKYEFWNYYISELHKRKIPTLLISAVFRQNQIFFKNYGKFYLNILKKYTKIFVQDKHSKGLLEQAGVDSAQACGDTRIDRVVEIANQKYKNQTLEKFAESCFTLVAGSTWPEDEKILTEIINRNTAQINMIIAPHEVNENNIQRLESQINTKTIRFSKLESNMIDNQTVIIIDNIGVLSKLYRFADFAYIGGGFGRGVHNILEAAVYGIPVSFGPVHKKFNEAKDLINIGVAHPITSYNDLQIIITKYLSKGNLKSQCSIKAKKYFTDSKGATEIIVAYLKNL